MSYYNYIPRGNPEFKFFKKQRGNTMITNENEQLAAGLLPSGQRNWGAWIDGGL